MQARTAASPREWLAGQRGAAAERLAMLSTEQRRLALSLALEPAEERLLGRYLELGRADGGCSLAVVDAIVLDERASDWLTSGMADSAQATASDGAPLAPAAEALEHDLSAAEHEAATAGWSAVAEQARLGLVRVRTVRSRLGLGRLTEARLEARATIDAEGARGRRRERLARVCYGVAAVVLAATTALTLRALVQDVAGGQPDPRQAIGAEDFRDLFDLDRIVVEGDRFVAVARNWSAFDEADRDARVDELCRRLDARGFGAAWLDDRWLRRIAGCGPGGATHAR
jgi:hypothetical protein